MERRMRNGWLSRLNRCEQGVAMVTVIFVAAALTVVSSTAAFVAVNELRAGVDDRKASEALAYAEAGVDRAIQYLRGGSVVWGQLKRAGCQDPPLTLGPVGVGNGQFTVRTWVYEPDGPSPTDKLATQHPRNAGTSGFACANVPVTPRQDLYMAIESTGEHPAAKRVVRQVVLVKPRPLPIGVAAEQIHATGTQQTVGIS